MIVLPLLVRLGDLASDTTPAKRPEYRHSLMPWTGRAAPGTHNPAIWQRCRPFAAGLSSTHNLHHQGQWWTHMAALRLRAWFLPWKRVAARAGAVRIDRHADEA